MPVSAGFDYWDPIAEEYKLNMEIVNKYTDPIFSFIPIDRDGKIQDEARAIVTAALEAAGL